jgi:hypothetical protein
MIAAHQDSKIMMVAFPGHPLGSGLTRVKNTATVLVFKFEKKTGPVNRYTQRSGLLGSVRVGLPTFFCNRAGPVNRKPVKSDRFPVVFLTLGLTATAAKADFLNL